MNNKAAQGSLTIEAAVVLPFFLLLFFVFLIVIKSLCVQIVLDHAVRETAKEIAAKAYIISFFNNWEDELAGEIQAGTAPKEASQEAWDIIENLLAGKLRESELEGTLSILAGAAYTRWETSIETIALQNLSQYYYSLKESGKYYVARTIMSKHLSTNMMAPDKLVLRTVQLPQSNREAGISKDELIQEVGFTKDDVVIQAEYLLEIPLPFFKDNTVLLKNTTIERAWLSGGNGVYTDREERGIFENLQPEKGSIVYVTRTGIKYHMNDCRYLRKSKIPLSLEEAKKNYRPCKVCRPPK